MTKKNLIIIGITALITAISVTLPGYLYLRGLSIGWALALLAGYAAVAILSFVMGKRLKRFQSPKGITLISTALTF